jgi:DnaJ-class molecular chaperone
MESFDDYYEILQVHHLAEPEVIAAAYKKLAQKYHPDINQNPSTLDKMKKINIAHDILSDPGKRRQYDLERRMRKLKVPGTEESKPASTVRETRQRAPASDIVSPFTLYYCPKCKKSTVCFNRRRRRYECSKCKRHWEAPQDIK